MNVSKRGWNGRRGNGTERTQVDAIAHKVLELLPINRERSDVAGVLALVHPDGDPGGPIDDTEPAAVRMFPLAFDFGEQLLEIGEVLVLLLQGVPFAIQRLCAPLDTTTDYELDEADPQHILVCGERRLDLAITEIEKAMAKGFRDAARLFEEVEELEKALGTDERDNMFVCEGEDSVAGIAAARLHLLE